MGDIDNYFMDGKKKDQGITSWKSSGATPGTPPTASTPSSAAPVSAPNGMDRTKAAVAQAGTVSSPAVKRFEYDPSKADRTREAATRSSGGFKTNSALNEYEAAKRRASLFRGTGSSSYELDRAKTKLSDMGITDDEVNMWDRSPIKDRSAISSMLDSKRDALRSTPGLDPKEMKYDEKKRVWFQEGFTPQAQAAKAPSQFQGFVSDTHREQMDGTQGQARPVKVNFNVPTGDTDVDVDTAPFSIINDTIKTGMQKGSVGKRTDGSYYFSQEALKGLAASGALSDAESQSLMKSQYGATMSLSRGQNGSHVASFTAAGQGMDERSLGDRAKTFLDSAYGKHIQHLNSQVTSLERSLSLASSSNDAPGFIVSGVAHSENARQKLNSIMGKSKMAMMPDGKSLGAFVTPSAFTDRGVPVSPGNLDEVTQEVNNAYRAGSGQSEIDYSKPAQSKEELAASGKAKRDRAEWSDKLARRLGVSV